MKILIIEDEKDLAKALKKGLEKREYLVDLSYDGEEGLELYYINDYDLIILDLNLPSMDGIDILKYIRSEDKKQRILILSARSSVSDKVKGLDLGANDYLAKPFDFRELDARVRSILRSSTIQEDSLIEYEGLKLDTLTREVFIGGKLLDLAPREYALLEYLILNRDRVVSTEEILEHVWHSDFNLFSDSVKVHISNIRKKISKISDIDYIKTVRGMGYIIDLEDKK